MTISADFSKTHVQSVISFSGKNLACLKIFWELFSSMYCKHLSRKRDVAAIILETFDWRLFSSVEFVFVKIYLNICIFVFFVYLCAHMAHLESIATVDCPVSSLYGICQILMQFVKTFGTTSNPCAQNFAKLTRINQNICLDHTHTSN